MNAKQFAWIYLIENGVAGLEHSFYGGWDIVDTRLLGSRKINLYGNGIEVMKNLHRDEILKVGVDWEKTLEPRSDIVSEFTDTFHDPDHKEVLIGKLVLKNGQVQQWSADALKVTNVFEMMANVHSADARFGEIFGWK